MRISDWSSDVCSSDLDAQAPLTTIRDGHRVLVGEADILGNAAQIEALRAGGYEGYLSFEPFAQSIHELADIRQALGASMNHRSEEHTSELQSLMRTSYDVFCLKKKTNKKKLTNKNNVRRSPTIE